MIDLRSALGVLGPIFQVPAVFFEGVVGGSAGTAFEFWFASVESSIAKTSSSVATPETTDAGRCGRLECTCSILVRFVIITGGERRGLSLNAKPLADGTMGTGISCNASQSPHHSMALSTILLERATGDFVAWHDRTYIDNCLTTSADRLSSRPPSRSVSMLIAMYACKRLIREKVWK